MTTERKSQQPELLKETLELTKLEKKKVTVVFDEPQTSSDGGAVVLREAAMSSAIVSMFTDALSDRRRQSDVKHQIEELVSQRVMQICCGWEDAWDCNDLRDDLVIKLASGCDPAGRGPGGGQGSGRGWRSGHTRCAAPHLGGGRAGTGGAAARCKTRRR